jgi:hypothetical protein
MGIFLLRWTEKHHAANDRAEQTRRVGGISVA